MDDAALVAAARAGDREAWGLVYDRYADRLHDHCWSILRDEHEAADALHDAFVKAAGAIGQLRDPSRLRPWLYAIARNEAFRRHRARARAVPTEDLGVDDDGEFGTVNVDLDVGSGTPVDDLRTLVWDAAGGLSADDQALLDLHLRQGLEGEELAEAMGITANNAYVKLSRLRDTLERSLGALLVARTGSRDCAELAALLAGWDGVLSPILRKRVARHIDGCHVCDERKRSMVSPLALLAGVPLLPAPAALRDRILDDAVATASANPPPPVPAGGGPPTMVTPVVAAASGGGGGRATAWVVAAVVAMVAVALLAFGLFGDDDDDVATGTTTTTTTGETTTTSSTTSSTSSTTSTTSTSTTSTTALPVTPGVVAVEGGAIDLGTTGTAGSFTVRNRGGTAISYVLTTTNAVLRTTQLTGSLDPGEARTVTVQLDRANAPEGPFVLQVRVDAGAAGQAVVTVSGTVAVRPPRVDSPESALDEIFAIGCPASDPKTSTITVHFTEENVETIELRWTPSSPSGPAAGSTPMSVTGSTATADLGPFAAGDDELSYVVVVTDAFGATATSSPQTITVTPCAQ